ncbi:osmoprotectant NAGGN system M42 family peptidase [Kordiimonas sp.]|uniref:osmoprotectant NAGGN system M42 family peptidase n=1 Tax=Kordiimonas sp. TaxID=1970157 RepID=UPI003B524B42
MNIDQTYLVEQLKAMLAIPSPVGMVGGMCHHVCGELEKLGVNWQQQRRGSIVATLDGEQKKSDRAISAHLDTLGAMVVGIKPNGRLKIRPLGHWSSRFAEGARVTIHTKNTNFRGSILPEKSAGHVFNEEIDSQSVNWHTVELRVDASCGSDQEARKLGLDVGNIVALDAESEFLPNGYICSRYLDDKAGVACLLAAIKAVKELNQRLAVECHPIFSVAEETGCGCSHAPDADVGELIAVDIGPVATGQNSSEHTVNLGVLDTSGIYDRSLLNKLEGLCVKNAIPYKFDSYPFYRSDTHSAQVAGLDLVNGLIAFGTESTHGYERTHIDSLMATATLIAHYMVSEA